MKLTRFRYRDHKTGKIVRGVKIREQSKPSAPKGRRSAIISKAGLYNEVAAADYVGLSVSRLQNRRWRTVTASVRKARTFCMVSSRRAG